MTGATADRFEIPKRGYLKPGYYADITVIDPNTLRVDEKRPDFTLGGIRHVLVNGIPIILDGNYIGGTHGKVVLKSEK